jgi:GH24 family phage-related lysozyme (muramidase)
MRGAMAAGCGSFSFSTLQRWREHVRWATARATHVGAGLARRRRADHNYCLCPTGETSYAVA